MLKKTQKPFVYKFKPVLKTVSNQFIEDEKDFMKKKLNDLILFHF